MYQNQLHVKNEEVASLKEQLHSQQVGTVVLPGEGGRGGSDTLPTGWYCGATVGGREGWIRYPPNRLVLCCTRGGREGWIRYPPNRLVLWCYQGREGGVDQIPSQQVGTVVLPGEGGRGGSDTLPTGWYCGATRGGREGWIRYPPNRLVLWCYQGREGGVDQIPSQQVGAVALPGEGEGGWWCRPDTLPTGWHCGVNTRGGREGWIIYTQNSH